MSPPGSFLETCFFQWIGILFKELYLAHDWPSLGFIASFKQPIHQPRKNDYISYFHVCAYCLLVIDFLLMVQFCSQRGAVAIRQPYIRVVGIEEINESSSRGHAAFTIEEVQIEITAYNCFNTFSTHFFIADDRFTTTLYAWLVSALLIFIFFSLFRV